MSDRRRLPLSYPAEVMENVALSELLGAAVIEPNGAVAGRVREVAIDPQEEASSIACFVVRTRSGDRLLSMNEVGSIVAARVQATRAISECAPFASSEGLLMLDRDLLDQQVIDIHGRKVVRVNDVEFKPVPVNGHIQLSIGEVDVGARGAVRRLLKGVVPQAAVRALVERIPARNIPWEFIDLIETDPSRRVRLKIAHERLSKLHPADIADILEELAPAEREAVFDTLDEEVAAGALEEIDPEISVSLVESLDSDRAADIVEEMDPDAAADLLAELSEETSEEILEEMEPEERAEVSELLEYHENTAAGRMTTDYLSLGEAATVADAIAALREFEGGIEGISTVYLTDAQEKLVAAVPLARLVLLPAAALLREAAAEPLISCPAGANEKDVAELFDKYNLLALPVTDDEGRLTGVITADDVISLLRSKL
jgi:magnesium transporter